MGSFHGEQQLLDVTGSNCTIVVAFLAVGIAGEQESMSLNFGH
jgi:hypothetical protein